MEVWWDKKPFIAWTVFPQIRTSLRKPSVCALPPLLHLRWNPVLAGHVGLAEAATVDRFFVIIIVRYRKVANLTQVFAALPLVVALLADSPGRTAGDAGLAATVHVEQAV